MPRTYHILTFGCQMNSRDSETIAGILQGLGWDSVESPDGADLVLFNTCSVRENPERKVYGRLYELAQIKQERPEMIIGVCGCMVQQEVELDRIRQDLSHVDLVFGTHNIHQLPDLLNQIEERRERAIEVWQDAGEVVEGLPVRRNIGVMAYVNVSFGCNNFCTYCIVPYTRGRERSRRPEDIKAEVTRLAEEGYREVTLLGQNVNSYGLDLKEKVPFAELLQMLNEVPAPLSRIRFMTSHPKDISPELIAAMARLEKVCEHLHLPVQAGSDRILKKMNRGYTSAEYLSLVEQIRQENPGISLTTDLIVGFPGEEEEDFQQTLDLIRKVRYDAAFTFLYNPRKGTPAAGMTSQIPEEIKKDRLYRLIQAQNEISLQANLPLVGSIQEVLVEGRAKQGEGQLVGKTRTHKTVHFPGGEDQIGRLIPVRISQAQTWSLQGVAQEES